MRRLTVLFGSQTGSAEEVAERVGRDASRRAFEPVRVCALDAYDRGELVNEELVVLVVATTGDGDPPDNMRQFWRFILRKGLPGDVLQGLRFVVFGLGDSSYAKYNVMAKKLRNRLLQLGATEVATRGFGDDQSQYGLEGDLDRWLPTMWEQVLALYPLPKGYVVDDSPRLFKPRNAKVAVEEGGVMDAAASIQARCALLATQRPLGCYETELLTARVRKNERLTAPDWEQDVRHVELDVVSGPCPPYVAGDIAVVFVENVIPDEVLAKYLNKLGLAGPDAVVSVLLTPEDTVPRRVTMRDLFCKYLDVLGTPRRRFFEALYFFTSDEDEKEKFEEFCSPEGTDLFFAYCKKERKTYLEVFDDFQTCRPPLEYLVEMIPPLGPREYSIASSRVAHGDSAVHLCIAVLEYTTPWGRKKKGVASRWVQERLATSSEVNLYIKRGSLRAPADAATPLVMIGPGTGVAPMRALIHERGSSASHLYFGCRSQAKDYYYAEEWQGLVAAGKLGSVRTAFSRDQQRKIYVQNLLREDHEALHNILVRQGGVVFISGSAERMPTEVREAIVEALGKHMESADEAKAFVARCEREGRLKIEAWS
ncbi:NADPH-dependent diflavin oxidoreductase 1 (NADPH-dependent FMN and FAD-containing oxidoreductase) [Durusdinium trenchii]|uniref:NADPH-dependent diflavin oxidoreductase 1 n=1 Tax=Durusdinium trenchii TaxID=1381693 RepID=A0ABP0QFB1_9DINO